jgi:hypothetical protein
VSFKYLCFNLKFYESEKITKNKIRLIYLVVNKFILERRVQCKWFWLLIMPRKVDQNPKKFFILIFRLIRGCLLVRNYRVIEVYTIIFLMVLGDNTLKIEF